MNKYMLFIVLIAIAFFSCKKSQDITSAPSTPAPAPTTGAKDKVQVVFGKGIYYYQSDYAEGCLPVSNNKCIEMVIVSTAKIIGFDKDGQDIDGNFEVTSLTTQPIELTLYTASGPVTKNISHITSVDNGDGSTTIKYE